MHTNDQKWNKKNENTSNDDTNVDYTFYYRSQVNQVIDDAVEAEVNKEYHKVYRLLNDVRHMEPQVIPVIRDRLRYATREEMSILTHLLIVLGDRKNIEDSMTKMLLDPKIPDYNKGSLLSIMEIHGYTNQMYSMNAVFHDPEKMIEESKETMVEDVKKNPLAISSLFREMQDMPMTGCHEFLETFKNRQDYKLVDFFKSLALLDDPALARVGVSQLGNIPHKASKRALKELLAQPDRYFISGEIERELQRLNLIGLEALDNQPEAETHLEAHFRLLKNQCYAAVTQLDANCNRVVVFARPSDKLNGKFFTMTFNINVQKGITQCYGFQQDTLSEFRNLVQELRIDETLVIEDVHYVRDIFRDALNQNLENGGPFPYEFAFWRQFMPSDWLKPERFTPSFKEELAQLPENVKEQEREIRALSKYERFMEFVFDHPYVQELSKELLRIHPRQNCAKLLFNQEMLEAVYEDFLEEMIFPRLEEYKRTFLLMADMYRRRGWNRLSRRMLLAAKWIGKGDFETIKQHPLFMYMGSESLEATANFLFLNYNRRNWID